MTEEKKVKNFDWFKIDGKWHHCIWVCSKGKQKQYVDGVLVMEQNK